MSSTRSRRSRRGRAGATMMSPSRTSSSGRFARRSDPLRRKRCSAKSATPFAAITGACIMPNTQVVMETSQGNLKIELEDDKAPITVKNFLAYVDEGFYNGTIFHRVIPNFMIQGGGFEPGLKQKKTKGEIKNESTNGLANKRGTLAM